MGKVVSGLISDRPLKGRRRPVLLACALITFGMCAFFALTGSTSQWWIYPALIIFGLAAIGWAGLYGTLAGEIGGPARAGSAIGLTGAALNLGILVGPPIFGYLVDTSGSFKLSWLLLAGCAAVAAACFLFLREPNQSSPVVS